MAGDTCVSKAAVEVQLHPAGIVDGRTRSGAGVGKRLSDR
jgi:hypothetical protein